MTAAPQRTYRHLLDLLWQFEGWCCLWRVAVGVQMITLVPVLAIGGFIAGAYLAGDLGHPTQVALGAVVALGVGQLLSGYIWRNRPWRKLIEDRLSSYEHFDPPADVNAMIRRSDFVLASRALRRAKLNPVGGTHVPSAAPGSQDLDLKLLVQRSAQWHPEGSPELHVQIQDCLRAAKDQGKCGGGGIVSVMVVTYRGCSRGATR
jgi:hypothetical protein